MESHGPSGHVAVLLFIFRVQKSKQKEYSSCSYNSKHTFKNLMIALENPNLKSFVLLSFSCDS